MQATRWPAPSSLWTGTAFLQSSVASGQRGWNTQPAGGLSGLDLAQTVRAQHAGLPVILATGYSERAEAARRDGFLLLAKPYSLETLMRAIQQVLREKQSEKQSA